MIKEDVKHLFDRSACLNKRQFEAYLSGNMITEEVYGIEHHINGCPLCSMAMDGMQLRKDALEVSAGLNTDFIKDHFAMMPQQSSSGASYIKNLKPKEINTKPLMTTVKVLVAIGACAAILWFVQSVGKNNSNEPVEETKQEEVVNVATPPQQEEQQVIVEEPLMADTTQAAEPVPEAAPVQEKPAIGPPEDKPVVSTRPATTASAVSTKPAIITKPVGPVTKPVAINKPLTPTTKPTTVPPKPVATKQTVIPNLAAPATTTAPPPVVKEIPREEPKPVVKQEERPAPKEEPKPKPTPPAPKKEEASEDLPSDPIAAGKALMDKRSYNAAINRMRNEMRSNNKSRRQEAVILVARCYQAMGNKDRAAELLKSVVDEGGPEKKNAKKLLKEVDKNAVKDDE
jgi:FimV-like protein